MLEYFLCQKIKKSVEKTRKTNRNIFKFQQHVAKNKNFLKFVYNKQNFL